MIDRCEVRRKWQQRFPFPSLVSRLLSPAFGFTLIELVLVTAVIGILLVVSIPRFQQTAQRLRLEQTAFAFAHLLRYTHERAVSQGQDMVWTWEDATHQMRSEPVVAEAPVGGGDQPASLPQASAVSDTIPEGFSLTLLRHGEPVGCQCIHFFLDGTSEATILTLHSREAAYTIQVDEATGQVVLTTGTSAR